MPDLNTQIREYFDATAPPLEVEEAVGDEVRVPGGKKTPSRRWTAPGWAYGMATMTVVLVIILGLALLLPGGNENDVVEPTPTTVAPAVETLTDLEIIHAGVEALYSGDAERAVELFELQEPTDDQIRSEAVWQAAIGGRLTLGCAEQATPGVFTCHAPYHNAITDAINYRDGGDTFRVVVEDGVIREFSFPEHSGLMAGLAGFILGVEGNQACEQEELLVLPRTAECANMILDNLDEWAASDQVVDQTTVPTPTTVLEPAPSEVSIARAFLDARNAYDVESATALFTSDPHVHGTFITGVDMYPALFDWLRATGWQWMVDECHMKSGDANTVCSYHVENAWSRAMGLEPVQGSIGFEIWDGGMNAVPDFNLYHTSYFGDRARPNEQLVEVWETVIDWIRANHPTDLGAMISEDGSAPLLDARSIDLWRLYTEEFVEFHAP
jgi:hypothetical protein